MSEKCFCHFNGYEVKDAKARREIEELKNNASSNLFLHNIDIYYELNSTFANNIRFSIITNFNDEITVDNIVQLFKNFYKFDYGTVCIMNHTDIHNEAATSGRCTTLKNYNIHYASGAYPGAGDNTRQLYINISHTMLTAPYTTSVYSISIPLNGGPNYSVITGQGIDNGSISINDVVISL